MSKKIKDGPYKKKIKDRLFEKGIIKNGKPNGHFEISYTNGYIVENGIFKNGKRHGLCIVNSQSEDQLLKFHELIKYKNGKRDGQYTFYCYDRIEKIGFYKNDKKHGVFKTYHHKPPLVDGPLLPFEQITYKNGKKHGSYFQFHWTNGTLRSEGSYQNDKLVGTWKYYDDNGNLTGEDTYKKDKIHGPSYEYYENGTIRRVVNYKNDKKDGFEKYYDEDGLLQEEETYKNDQRTNRKYYTNGKLDMEEIYKNGEHISDKYYKDGILQKEEPSLDKMMEDDVDWDEIYEKSEKEQEKRKKEKQIYIDLINSEEN